MDAPRTSQRGTRWYHAQVFARNGAGKRVRFGEGTAMATSNRIVLVTGAGGRIGPYVLPTLRERCTLRLLDRRPVDAPEPTILADLSDPGVLCEALRGVDTVVHLAATSDEAPFVEELVPNNIVGLYHLMDAVRAEGVRRVVFASTVQAVGNHPPDMKIAASDPPRPVTHYGCTKAFGEVLGRFYHDKHGVEFVAIRIGWFHPYDSPLLATSRAARSIWLSPRDAAGILLAAIECPEVGFAIVNATSITETERLSRSECRGILGYEPIDDVRDIPFTGAFDNASGTDQIR